MSAFLGDYIIAPFVLSLLIPLVYVLIKKRTELRTILLISFASVLIVLLYPVVSRLANTIPYLGYSIGKVLLFVAIPAVTVKVIDGGNPGKIASELGVRERNLSKSIGYGLMAAIITISLGVISVIISPQPVSFDFIHRVILFFEAFTEEFFFRGFLFLYLMKKTDVRIAYLTSISGFILMHPQHFFKLQMISVIAQAILLTIVTHKTKNIIGPWISHGLNRFVPALILSLLQKTI